MPRRAIEVSKRRNPKKKVTSKQRSLRGRGGSRGPVRVKLARVIQNQGLLKSENLDVYEDKMVCATDGPIILPPTKRRGRQKKNVAENQKTSSVNSPNPRQVVYIPSPSSRKKSYNIVPLKNQVTVSNSQGVSKQVSILKPNVHLCKSMNRVIPASSGRPQHMPPVRLQHQFTHIPHNAFRNVQASASSLQKEEKKPAKVDTYPEDLKELEREYDELVGSKVWEIICWMDPSTRSLKYPRLVQKNHELVKELFPSPDLGTQVNDVVDWLKEHFPTNPDQPQFVLPKVVVETQPNHLQDCNQWSSMTES